MQKFAVVPSNFCVSKNRTRGGESTYSLFSHRYSDKPARFLLLFETFSFKKKKFILGAERFCVFSLNSEIYEKRKNYLTYGKSFPQGVENFVKNSKNVDVARVFSVFIM